MKKLAAGMFIGAFAGVVLASILAAIFAFTLFLATAFGPLVCMLTWLGIFFGALGAWIGWGLFEE